VAAGVVVAAVIISMLLALAPSTVATGDRARWPMKQKTNQSRVRHDIRRVDLRASMSERARRHSVRMARRGELFHTPNPPAYYLRGVRWSVWGENVGYTSGSVDGLQRMFMRSPPHRSNILNGRFRHVAIGTHRRDGTLWVTVFFYG
jgi:uncharacterized protein YkwD